MIWNFKKKFEIQKGNKYVTVSFYSDKINYQYGGKSQNFEVNYLKYISYNGPHDDSGAYVFRPADPTIKHPTIYNLFKSKSLFVGNIISVLHMEGSHADTQIRFYNEGSNHDPVVEVQSHIYSIPGDGIGKEIVIQMQFDVNNNGEFYTDSNGLELMYRKLNYRPTFKMDPSEPAAGNFFPVNKMIQINDTNSMVTVLNDRSQAGTSLKSGQIELMVHRRLFSDDGHGVNEDLNEFNEDGYGGLEATVRHWIVFGDNNLLANLPREIQFRND